MGTNFAWDLINYSGPTWFGIVENSIQGGQALASVNYYYQAVEGNNITITSNMLEDFQSGTKVTIYLGIGNYIKSEDDLFVLASTTKSHSHKVVK